jgi:hypothetical protein
MAKLTDTFEVDFVALSDTELHMIRELIGDNESVWNEQKVFDGLKEKLYKIKRLYYVV